MAEIKGKVIDKAARDKGIKGAVVTATDAQNKVTNSTPKNTPISGEYSIKDLAVGAYTVKVTAPAGYQDPPQEDITVNTAQDTIDIYFELQLQPGTISGRVTDEKGIGVSGKEVKAKANDKEGTGTTDSQGYYIISELDAGFYTVEVVDEGFLSARYVEVFKGAPTTGIDFSQNVVKDFIRRLDDLRFSIETPISIEEANQAVSLFYVSNIMLAGLGQRRVGSEEKTDMLGVISLYYGLQDKSLTSRLVVQNSDRLWSTIGSDLKNLATRLDQLQSDVDFLTQETKRQFNLGTNNSVPGNAQFPVIFNRYAEIAMDPLLSIDIREEEENRFFDKEKLAKAYDLLKELKGIILQVVRSLSKYGTAATKRVNEDWSGFEALALEVLATMAQERITDDVDEKNPWAVLAVLTEKNRETQIAPYVVLGRHGGKLLEYAMNIYLETKDQLDNFDQVHLRDLFQPRNKDFWTDLIRKEAAFIKRYPLQNWG
jgi:hypothetical protein